jgi:hypothetical protein
VPDRQGYISPVLTHLAGSTLNSDDERYELLTKILKEGWITYPPHDQSTKTSKEILIQYTKNISESTNEMYVTSMVCFCDIPITDLQIHVDKYSRFGLAFDKHFIASHGGGPVYYVPKNASPAWPDGEDSTSNRGQVFDRRVKDCYHLLDELICADDKWSEQARKVNRFLNANLFAYIRGFDHRLADKDRDNYYFEREWRILGSLNFGMSDVRRIFLPKGYADKFRKDFPGLDEKLEFL